MGRALLRVGHVGKCTSKVGAGPSFMCRLRLVEWVDQLGCRLSVRSAQSRLRIGQKLGDIDMCTCFESAAYAIVSIVRFRCCHQIRNTVNTV